MENYFKAKVNNSIEFDSKEIDLKNLDLIRISPKHFHMLQNSKSYKLKLESSNFNERPYTFLINNNKLQE